MKYQATIMWVAALLVAAVGFALWSAKDKESAPPQEVVARPDTPPEEPEEPETPKFPIEPPVVTRAAEEPELTPLPPLAESDAYFEMEMVELFGRGMGDLLKESGLIERIVTTVDNLPREQVAEKVRPLEALLGSFAVDGQDGSGEFTLNQASYVRYDFLVNMLDTADIATLADSYRRFYPLFQEAYVNLGYPNGHFNDRAVEVVDHLLATPDPDEPLALVRPHVLYEFADPELEGLSSGQKLLIRVGGEHRLRVKQFLEELRVAITSEGAQSDTL